MELKQILSLLCIFFVAVESVYYLDPKKVVFMDISPPFNNNISNYLFRGNEPKILLNDTLVVAYDLLKTYMAASAKKSGFLLPDDFYLLDLKYVYTPADPFEKPDIALEEAFFKQYPSYGEVQVEDIWGDAEDPNFLPSDEAEKKAVTLSQWQHDNLPVYIPALRQLLYTPTNRSLVIYAHCECGCDRTGEIAAAYVMAFQNVTYQKAIAWDRAIAGRPILPNHKFAVEWYCYYLNYVQRFSFPCE